MNHVWHGLTDTPPFLLIRALSSNLRSGLFSVESHGILKEKSHPKSNSYGPPRVYENRCPGRSSASFIMRLPSFPPSPSPFPTDDRDNRKTKQGAITCICGRHARASLSSYAGGIFSRSSRVPFKIGGLLCRPSSLPFQMLRPKCRQIPRGKL